MCSRGVFQLRKLTVFFCDFGGSSSGVRQLISSVRMKQFMQSNPQIQFDFVNKRNHHPYIRGSYVNGYSKDVPLRNSSNQQVQAVLQSLRNQLGRKAFKVSGKRIYNTIKSIQGEWQPNLFNSHPRAELSKIYEIPSIPDQYKTKFIQKYGLRKEDPANKLSKLRPHTDPHRPTP